jgi:3-hydroxyisobutyrate dehydrogenase-like beta-hydroxyacid dehydrogenase
MVVFDAAGTAARAPAGTTAANSVAALAAAADTILLSLPDGKIVAAVAEEIAAAPGRRAATIVDLSTVGVVAAKEIGAALARQRLVFVDAPVSGGRAGAIAATITVMCAGAPDAIAMLTPVFESMAGNVIPVGTEPGQGQAMKLANNFLSSVAMAATSEAVHFGLSQGLEMKTMLDVLNVSTGRNTATSDKFPKRIATGTFDAGFAMPLMSKDVALYYKNAVAAGTVTDLGTAVAEIWEGAVAAMPDADFTRVYEFVGTLGAARR